jgi:hypothetical protein
VIEIVFFLFSMGCVVLSFRSFGQSMLSDAVVPFQARLPYTSHTVALSAAQIVEAVMSNAVGGRSEP